MAVLMDRGSWVGFLGRFFLGAAAGPFLFNVGVQAGDERHA